MGEMTVELRDTPIRNAGLVLKFTSMDQILRGSTMQSQGTDLEYRPLGGYLSNWFSAEEDYSKIACVVHGPKDGVVAAERLAEELSEKYHVVKWGVDQRNKTINANDLSQFIKKRSLIHAAKAQLLWKRPPVITELIITVLTAAIMPVLTYLLNNNILPPILAGIILLILAGNYIYKYRKCQKDGLYSLTATVKNNFTFNEYQDFLSGFNSNDFLCARYSAIANGDIIIVRDIYTPRHFLLLRQYLSNIKDDQIWVVFLERKDLYNDFLLEQTDYARKKVYYLKPLSRAEKKELARASNSSPDDPAIKYWGLTTSSATLSGSAS